MELLFLIWAVLMLVCGFLVGFLLSIDAIDYDFAAAAAIGIVFPPVILVYVIFILPLQFLYDTCRKNKTKIRKFLILKN